MALTYLLEMSQDQPTQFRITVLEDTTTAIMQHMINKPQTPVFVPVGPGYYDSPEACLAALEPYMAMANT
jgi:hypothetical protein